MQKTFKTARALVVALHIMTPFAATHAAYAKGKLDLPPPAVSRALDAILLPINPAVAREFKLGKGKGLLVLAVQPGGVADKQGIKAGDVLTEVLGHKVQKPIDVDVAVRRGLKRNNDHFKFGLHRGGKPLTVAAVITLALYEEVFSVSQISSWSSWSESTSFSYSEFVSEYSESIETSYESEESIVEEEVSQEETTSEESTSAESTSEESTTDDSATADTDGDGTPDAADDDDDNDGTPDAADTDDDNDGTDDSAESSNDAGDDGADDSADDAGDDAGDDGDAGDDAGDDSGGDDGGDDAGGDDSGGDDAE